MPSLTGRVLIAQEGRLHVLDAGGAGHLLLLSPKAAADTSQLADLAREQARVHIDYEPAPGVIGLLAKAIVRLDGPADVA